MGDAQQVTVAHASFWFVDKGGRHRVALRGNQVEVGAADFERGTKAGAFVVAPEVEETEASDEGERAKPARKPAAKA